MDGAKERPDIVQGQTMRRQLSTLSRRYASALGKYLKQDLEPDLWLELEKTYSDANFANTWESLFTMGTLFRRLGNGVASFYGFKYPEKDDERVSEYLGRIENLAWDATDI